MCGIHTRGLTGKWNLRRLASPSPSNCATMCYMAGNQKSPKYRRRAEGSSRAKETAPAYGTETVGVRELRQNLSVYLDDVKRGRSLIVTEHGRRVAILQPPPPLTTLERLVAEGKMTPPTRRITDLSPPLDLKLEKPLSQILQEMRDEDPW
jgi:prevent-host-death family protein